MANVSSERYRLTWMTRSQFVWEKRRHPPRTLKMVANDGERPWKEPIKQDKYECSNFYKFAYVAYFDCENLMIIVRNNLDIYTKFKKMKINQN